MCGMIFTLFGLLLDNNFLIFFKNIFNFSQEEGLFSLREVMAMPSSISAFSYVLKHPDGAMFASGLLTQEKIALIVYTIEAAKWSVLAIALIALFTKSKLIRDAEIFALLSVVISNLGIWVGGYTFILYVALIPILIKMNARWLYIGLISLMAIPLDIIPLLGDFIGRQYSYLANQRIEIFWTMGLGSVIRPIANLILLLSLSYEFLAKRNVCTYNNVVQHVCFFLGGSNMNYGFRDK